MREAYIYHHMLQAMHYCESSDVVAEINQSKENEMSMV